MPAPRIWRKLPSPRSFSTFAPRTHYRLLPTQHQQLLSLGIFARGCYHYHSSSQLQPSYDEDANEEPPNQEPYWQRVPRWKDVSEAQFLTHEWQVNNTVTGKDKLVRFLAETLPPILGRSSNPKLQHIRTQDEFIQEMVKGIAAAPMAVRLPPHILSCTNWYNPLDDPMRMQFIPLESSMVPDHSSLGLDSLNEKADSPVPGLVHRYPEKVLFLAISICPLYCRFCTRSYAVGAETDTVSKSPQKPSRKRWEVMFRYLEDNPVVQDVVVSGGDSYMLAPIHIAEIGNRLLSIPHIRRIRFATKGLAVSPSRILDREDGWTTEMIRLSNRARREGKQVCIHTHFNHPNEISWVTRKAAQYLWEQGVIVRNQTVLLKNVNDTIETMGTLIRELADMNIQPYYVYQCDLVQGIEDLRTPLQSILDIEQGVRGTIAGFMMPHFVVDLPKGGGKRLASTYLTYDRKTGISTFRAPGLGGKKAMQVYEYADPIIDLES